MFLLFLCSRRIEELSQSLAAQEKLAEQLSQEKQQLLHLLEEPADMEVQVRFGLYFLRHKASCFQEPYFTFICISFLLLCKKLLQTQWFKTTFIYYSSFCGSRVQAWFSWVFCSGSHKSEIKLSAGLLSQLEAHLGKVPLLSSLRLLEEYFCVTVEVMAACFFTANHGERQSLASLPSRHPFKRFT